MNTLDFRPTYASVSSPTTPTVGEDGASHPQARSHSVAVDAGTSASHERYTASVSPKRLHAFAEAAGGPFFVYDLDAMAVHLQRFRSAGVRPWFACKANPLGAVLNQIEAAGMGFDCASQGELEQVLARGAPGDRILLTGPGKNEAFLRRALEARVGTFVVESFHQLELLDRLAASAEASPRVLLRLQLDWSGGEKNVLGGEGVSAFGLEPEQWAMFPFSTLEAVQPRGFHVFQWGNILEASRLEAIWSRIAEEAESLAARLPFPFEILDLGGGLGITYGDEESLDWEAVTAAIVRINAAGSWKETWLEPGRYAVGAFGRYLTRVVDRKTVRGEHFLILEGGVNHLLRPAITNQAFPCRPLMARGGETTRFRVHGPLCTALDHLGTFDLPDEIGIGDWLVFDQCGAYGFTESMPYFLCHQLPGEAVWQNERLTWAREPESAAGWMR